VLVKFDLLLAGLEAVIGENPELEFRLTKNWLRKPSTISCCAMRAWALSRSGSGAGPYFWLVIMRCLSGRSTLVCGMIVKGRAILKFRVGWG